MHRKWTFLAQVYFKIDQFLNLAFWTGKVQNSSLLVSGAQWLYLNAHEFGKFGCEGSGVCNSLHAEVL